MLNKIKAGFAVLRIGKVVADPAKWKGRQVTATMVTALLWALVQGAAAYGFIIPVDAEIIDGLAVGIIATVNGLLTYATSSKVGI